MTSRISPKAAGCVPLLLASAALAQQSDGNEQPVASDDLSTITVIGTRTERTLKELAATVSVISAEDIEQQAARTISDLVRYEPGVSVGGTGDRFGLSGFTIRGIGGNRVLTMVDGIRVPEEFSFGPFLSARRDLVDVDSVSRAEIARGPISSLYGSDALGGVVAFTTKAPQDYLSAEKPFSVGLKAGYSSADDSTVGTLTLAGGSDRLSGLLVYTNRNGSELENQGSVGGTGPTRELPNPQDQQSDNVVAKLAFAPSQAHEFTLGVDYLDAETDTQILSDYGTVVRGTLINSRDAIDTRERTRVSLRYEYDGSTAFADRVVATLYDQRSETIQRTLESRTTPAQEAQTRQRDSFFNQDIEGAYLQLSKGFDVGNSAHLVTYGVDYYATDNRSLRNGGTFNASGTPIPEFLPLPTRDFPITETDLTAFFLQDEISLFDDRLLLTPGLRYDSFDANAIADDVYLTGNPGSPTPADFSDSELTGRIGAVYQFTDTVSGYAQFSEGFRAPPYDDVNVGFSNFAGGYKTIANEDLRSERSQGFEVGMRLDNEIGNLNINVFHTEYDDFIESFAIATEFLPSGVDPADGLLTFQSINRDKVTIEGAELTGRLNLGSVSGALEQFVLRAAVAYAEGEDETTGQPINSIEPLNGVLGLAYSSNSGRWGSELVLTLVDGKDESDIDESMPRVPTAGYGLVDLLAYARFTDNIVLNVGLFNVTDRTYVRWVDTAAIDNDAVARFTQPGFNAAATLRVEF